MTTKKIHPPALIGMKAAPNEYHLTTLGKDAGHPVTGLVLSNYIDYVSVKKLLRYHYSVMLKYSRDQLPNAVKDAPINSPMVFNALELDAFIDGHLKYELAYIFYPEKSTWKVYQLPQQNEIAQYP